MTILNNYSQLYWLTRLDGLKAMFLTISVLSGIALGLTILFSIIMADIEIKKQTPWEKQRRIKNDLNRFNMYELPNRTNRYGRRRNN